MELTKLESLWLGAWRFPFICESWGGSLYRKRGAVNVWPRCRAPGGVVEMGPLVMDTCSTVNSRKIMMSGSLFFYPTLPASSDCWQTSPIVFISYSLSSGSSSVRWVTEVSVVVRLGIFIQRFCSEWATWKVLPQEALVYFQVKQGHLWIEEALLRC